MSEPIEIIELGAHTKCGTLRLLPVGGSLFLPAGAEVSIEYEAAANRFFVVVDGVEIEMRQESALDKPFVSSDDFKMPLCTYKI